MKAHHTESVFQRMTHISRSHYTAFIMYLTCSYYDVMWLSCNVICQLIFLQPKPLLIVIRRHVLRTLFYSWFTIICCDFKTIFRYVTFFIILFDSCHNNITGSHHNFWYMTISTHDSPWSGTSNHILILFWSWSESAWDDKPCLFQI